MKTFREFVTESDSQYEIFFKKKLKDAGYDSPKDIPDDKKSDFFDMVDKEWKADNE